MLLSLGLIFIFGLGMASLCKLIKLPRIIGMLFTGILLGSYALDVIDSSILNISSDLRQMALIIILIKAGLSLNIDDLKQVGRPAILMAFLPATFEILAYLIFAPMIFGINYVEALVLGSVLAAVSPAIVIPSMVHLIDRNYGTKKSVPQLILAGASCDDIFVIVLFTSFSTMAVSWGATDNQFNILSFFNVPFSVVFGVLVGVGLGLLLDLFFEYFHKKKSHIRNSFKVIIILGFSFLLHSLEHLLPLPFSGLLAIVSMACVYKLKTTPIVTQRLSQKFGKIWLCSEILLFVLVGASVNIDYLFKAGLPAVLMILIGLFIRSFGVLGSLIKTNLNKKERLFCVIAYLPKATVQAAIGSVPLALGLDCGELVLTVAVLGIMITAPLGAIAIDMSYEKLLEFNGTSQQKNYL